MNLYFDGMIKTKTPGGKAFTLLTETKYPVDGTIKMSLDMEDEEVFELLLRIPSWSKKTSLMVNGVEQLAGAQAVGKDGYFHMERSWKKGDVIVLSLDMRTELVYPIPYGSQLVVNHVVWGANCMIATYDEEDPKAKHHVALRRGPIMLAQENRLGYSVDEPIALPTARDGYAQVSFPEKEIAPYEHMLELEVALMDGSKMRVTDYASAGKLWTEESKMAVWFLTV